MQFCGGVTRMEQEQGAKGRYTCNKPQWRRHSLSVAQAKPLAIDTAGQDLVLVMMAGRQAASQASPESRTL